MRSSAVSVHQVKSWKETANMPNEWSTRRSVRSYNHAFKI